MERKKLVALSIAMACSLIAGVVPAAAAEGEIDPDWTDITIGYSSYNVNFEYTKAQVDQFKEAVEAVNEEYGVNWKVITTDAQQDVQKQANDIDDLIAAGCKVINMNPYSADGSVSACKKVMDAGIPLFLTDRLINTDDYTAYFGGDNRGAGEDSAHYMAELIGEKGKVAHIQGTIGASATNERGGGFTDTIEAEYPDIEVVAELSANYFREEAVTVMEDILVNHPDIVGVFCDNDEMAYGATTACESLGRTDIKIMGCDGDTTSKEWLSGGKHENFVGTTMYLTGSQEVVDAILQMALNHGEYTGEKVNKIRMPLLNVDTVDDYMDLMYTLGKTE